MALRQVPAEILLQFVLGMRLHSAAMQALRATPIPICRRLCNYQYQTAVNATNSQIILELGNTCAILEFC